MDHHNSIGFLICFFFLFQQRPNPIFRFNPPFLFTTFSFLFFAFFVFFLFSFFFCFFKWRFDAIFFAAPGAIVSSLRSVFFSYGNLSLSLSFSFSFSLSFLIFLSLSSSHSPFTAVDSTRRVLFWFFFCFFFVFFSSSSNETNGNGDRVWFRFFFREKSVFLFVFFFAFLFFFANFPHNIARAMNIFVFVSFESLFGHWNCLFFLFFFSFRCQFDSMENDFVDERQSTNHRGQFVFCFLFFCQKNRTREIQAKEWMRRLRKMNEKKKEIKKKKQRLGLKCFLLRGKQRGNKKEKKRKWIQRCHFVNGDSIQSFFHWMLFFLLLFFFHLLTWLELDWLKRKAIQAKWNPMKMSRPQRLHRKSSNGRN